MTILELVPILSVRAEVSITPTRFNIDKRAFISQEGEGYQNKISLEPYHNLHQSYPIFFDF